MLPNHIMVYILSFLTLTELVTTHSVCKRMAAACDDDAVWMPWCKGYVKKENGRGGEGRSRGEGEETTFSNLIIFN